MIEIRRAETEDADVLGEIHARSWEAAYAPFFELEFAARAVQSRYTRWHDRIAANTGTILVATLDGRPLALSWSVASSARPGFAEIYSFYGHPDGWGSGIASALMAETLSRLHEDGFALVHLWTMRDTLRSRRFYTKSGFTETGAVRPFDFGDGNPLDQIEYERALSA